MVDASFDARMMERALFLAERGRGTTSPNPMVGAVVVSPAGVVIGRGAHLRAGEPHAEILALAAAGSAARGSTLYCTLEPCSYTGRTGPCVERIVEAGVARVVAAMIDPNPRVSGAGMRYLRDRRIETVVGVAEVAARRLVAPFATWITEHRPFIIAKTAISADGFVGREGGRVALTSSAANRYLHRQRAEVDAIAVGSGTVLADDPWLTVRFAWRGRPLLRVMFDWRMRVSPAARVFSTRSDGPVIMAVGHDAARARPADVAALEAAGADVEILESRAIGPVLELLAARDVTSLLVEGGPLLHDAFFTARLVDRVQRVETGVTLGAGVKAAAGFGAPAADARRRRLGGDLLVEWDVHRPD
jgi:diaminohydroxyphosphoribosylaminopyrimidine deaminase/5-amino-6-(5-phosphoribosylamino)uracil reductase